MASLFGSVKRPITPTNLTIPAAPWEGNDILLREFSKQHITPSYINWLNNPEVLRYSNQRFRKHTYESCLEYLITFANSHNKFFLIEERNSGNPLGTLTIYFNMHHQTADIGVMVGDSKSWGVA